MPNPQYGTTTWLERSYAEPASFTVGAPTPPSNLLAVSAKARQFGRAFFFAATLKHAGIRLVGKDDGQPLHPLQRARHQEQASLTVYAGS
jgi:hypothetical protein